MPGHEAGEGARGVGGGGAGGTLAFGGGVAAGVAGAGVGGVGFEVFGDGEGVGVGCGGKVGEGVVLGFVPFVLVRHVEMGGWWWCGMLEWWVILVVGTQFVSTYLSRRYSTRQYVP